jgi:hypothetical protein
VVNDRFGPIDFDRFHSQHLAERLSGRPRIFTTSGSSALRSIAFRLHDGRSYTFVPVLATDSGATDSGGGVSGGGVSGGRVSSVGVSSFEVVAGDEDAHTVVELGYDDWCSFAWELQTCFALFYADRLKFPRGGSRSTTTTRCLRTSSPEPGSSI